MRVREEAEAACTYCGLALGDPAGSLGDNHMRVPATCPHEGFVHVSFMLDGVDRLAREHVDSRSCIVCRREGAGGIRPPTWRTLLEACQ